MMNHNVDDEIMQLTYTSFVEVDQSKIELQDEVMEDRHLDYLFERVSEKLDVQSDGSCRHSQQVGTGLYHPLRASVCLEHGLLRHVA